MRTAVQLLVISTLIFALLGCTKPVEPVKFPNPEWVIEKNYILGRKQAAFVGQPIISIRDYLKIQEPSMKANVDFSVDCPSINIHIKGKAGTVYPVKGQINYRNNTYLVLDISVSEEIVGILVNSEGKPINKLFISNTPFWAIGRVKITPDSLCFSKVYSEHFLKGNLNFEILYNGTDGNSFLVTYREYTPDNIARPAFTQNLVYENKSEIIRFRNIVIRVHEVTSEKIVYTVIEDGLSDNK